MGRWERTRRNQRASHSIRKERRNWGVEGGRERNIHWVWVTGSFRGFRAAVRVRKEREEEVQSVAVFTDPSF